MKYTVFIILISTLFVACGQQTASKQADSKDSSKLLSTSLIDNPSSANGADPVAVANMATMTFKDTLHDFGTIREGESMIYDFEFVNNGKTPLIITDAKGSCGCTAADYPNEPVPPGQGGTMKVRFNSEGKSGHQEKSVTISTNTARGTQMLYIKAEVTPSK